MRRLLFLFIICLLIPVDAFSAWAFVQDDASSADATSVTIVQAFGSNVTAASLLRANVGWACAGGETLSGVADSQTQTWTRIGSTVVVAGPGGNWCLGSFYFMNSAGGANTVTATFSATVTFRAIVVLEYSGIALTSALDQTTGQGQIDPGTGTDAVTSGNVITTAANELITGAFISVTISGGEAAGTGFTSRASTANTFIFLLAEDKNLVAAGTTAATFTAGGALADTMALVATFKEPGAAGSAPKSLMMMGVGD